MKRVLLVALSLIIVLPAHAADPVKPEDVYSVISNRKELSKFAELIDDAGVKDLLKSKDGSNVTVFAPSNSAISGISSDVWKRVKSSKENTQSFVKYHVIAGSRMTSSAINGRKSSSGAANGETVSFDGTEKGKMKVNDAAIETSDLFAPNGVVHIISAALTPPSFREAPKEPPPSKEEHGLMKGFFSGSDKKEEVAPVSTTTQPSVTVPVTQPSGAAAEAPTATAPTESTTPPPPQAVEPQKKKGFSIFGHTFGGG